MADESKNAVASDILCDVVQICVVTKDHVRTMERLWNMEMGPWRIFRFDPSNASETRYRGEPRSFTAVMAYANSVNMVWEIVEPTGGFSIFEDVLRHKGEGIDHLAISNKHLDFSKQIKEFENRGLRVLQSGRVWDGKVGFACPRGERMVRRNLGSA